MKRIFFIIMVVEAVLIGPLAAMSADECREVTAANRQHVNAGRAQYVEGNLGCEGSGYYAVGSEEFLGAAGSARTTLNTTDNGQNYHLGKCPAQSADEDADGYPADVDCNDADASIHPDAEEKCGDGIDQDCDGSDLQCTGCRQWTTTNNIHVAAKRAYTKQTSATDVPGCAGGGDGEVSYLAVGSDDVLGNTGSTRTTLRTEDGGKTYKLGECPTPDNDQDDTDQDGYPSDQDCDDRNANIHPGAMDFCGDGIDQDCDGADTKCTLPPSCIADLEAWKTPYKPKPSNCIACHTRCTYGGAKGVHSCIEGEDWGALNCMQCHPNVHK